MNAWAWVRLIGAAIVVGALFAFVIPDIIVNDDNAHTCVAPCVIVMPDNTHEDEFGIDWTGDNVIVYACDNAGQDVNVNAYRAWCAR